MEDTYDLGSTFDETAEDSPQGGTLGDLEAFREISKAFPGRPQYQANTQEREAVLGLAQAVYQGRAADTERFAAVQEQYSLEGQVERDYTTVAQRRPWQWEDRLEAVSDLLNRYDLTSNSSDVTALYQEARTRIGRLRTNEARRERLLDQLEDTFSSYNTQTAATQEPTNITSADSRGSPVVDILDDIFAGVSMGEGAREFHSRHTQYASLLEGVDYAWTWNQRIEAAQQVLNNAGGALTDATTPQLDALRERVREQISSRRGRNTQALLRSFDETFAPYTGGVLSPEGQREALSREADYIEGLEAVATQREEKARINDQRQRELDTALETPLEYPMVRAADVQTLTDADLAVQRNLYDAVCDVIEGVNTAALNARYEAEFGVRFAGENGTSAQRARNILRLLTRNTNIEEGNLSREVVDAVRQYSDLVKDENPADIEACGDMAHARAIVLASNLGDRTVITHPGIRIAIENNEGNITYNLEELLTCNRRSSADETVHRIFTESVLSPSQQRKAEEKRRKGPRRLLKGRRRHPITPPRAPVVEVEIEPSAPVAFVEPLDEAAAEVVDPRVARIDLKTVVPVSRPAREEVSETTARLNTSYDTLSPKLRKVVDRSRQVTVHDHEGEFQVPYSFFLEHGRFFREDGNGGHFFDWQAFEESRTPLRREGVIDAHEFEEDVSDEPSGLRKAAEMAGYVGVAAVAALGADSGTFDPAALKSVATGLGGVGLVTLGAQVVPGIIRERIRLAAQRRKIGEIDHPIAGEDLVGERTQPTLQVIEADARGGTETRMLPDYGTLDDLDQLFEDHRERVPVRRQEVELGAPANLMYGSASK